MTPDQNFGETDPMSLYHQIGGELALSVVVGDFWRRVSGDEVLSPWFADVDSEVFMMHLHAYLTVALDGPEAYGGRSMRHAHAGLKITSTAFDLLVTRMDESLIAAGVTPESIRMVDARLGLLRPVIVERES
jgi:hemoglobin